MAQRHTLLRAVIGLLFAFIAQGCSTKSEEFRYRITVEVDTPQGLRSGSSVIEVGISDPGRGPLVLPEVGVSTRVRGEAVVVDLPGKRTLFALLRKPNVSTGAQGFAYAALRPPRREGEYSFIKQTQNLKAITKLGVLPKMDYPLLVTFSNLADPKTVEAVNPDNLSVNFGEGVELRRITVQITNDPVTHVIERRLHWVSGAQEDAIIENVGLKDFSLAANLRKGHFRRDL